MTARVGCAVLAAGGSRRLGYPKQLLLAGGEPLVRRAAMAALAAANAGSAVIVGAEAARVSRALGDLRLTLLHNLSWELGVASSIRLAANWARASALDGLLLTVCDQPRLDARHLQQLVAKFVAKDVAVASFYSGVRAVPALFPRRLFDALAKLEGDVGASGILRKEGIVSLVPWPEGELDVDTPAQASNCGLAL
jgi:CTP:molybdopterin cytidylyltransferase MocA